MVAAQRTMARAQAWEVEGQQREKQLERMEKLVHGMEVVAQQISSEKVSSMQRSVLVSHFNDLQRQVNELDGIVGSEGRETSGQESVTRATVGGGKKRSFSVENREQGSSSRSDIPSLQRRIQTARRTVVVQRQQARKVIAQELQNLRPAAKTPESKTVRAALKDIPTQGLAAVAAGGGDQGRSSMVDLQA